ncbi:MAG: hypothetical protein JW965_06055 [Bacteroidales bacterium]|nr:hypothetical protein [Bacteroidales bacterium]
MKNLINLILVFIVMSCSQVQNRDNTQSVCGTSMEQIHKPYARYWWFASEIKKEDVRYNLNWLKDNGFGGVELAWVYPLNAMDQSLDRQYIPRYDWLSPEWQEAVNYAIMYADSIGLACDLTMGTLWPFGDSYVNYDEASQVFGQEQRQQITRSWEYPDTGYVVDHLLPANYMKYFNRMLDSYPHPETRLPQSYFIDSWEVETKGLWYNGLNEDFINEYGYDISPLMDSLYLPGYEDHLYDYMKLISGRVISFYENFDHILNENGIFSRGQCSGAPCDIISAYARMDIPEGEAMLYEPEFNSIPASAAILGGKNVISAESFTCLYGWPRNYIREEQTADLKMVADALFANGINHLIWHGKAHNPEGCDSVNFYASVHLGDSGALAGELPAFNDYLEKVSGFMKKGKPYTDVAVYLPTEDAWIKGIMPAEKQFIWAWSYYEMRYIYFPEALKGHHPAWINKEFLEEAIYENNELRVGDAVFNYLYVDAAFLDYESLVIITDLAKKGLPVTMKQIPHEAGTIKHSGWDRLINELTGLANVYREFRPHRVPLVAGPDVPPYRARETADGLIIFFANPASENIKFPVSYGQSFSEDTTAMTVRVNYGNNKYYLDLRFEPYTSLLYSLIEGRAEQMDISFRPSTPVAKKFPEDFSAPWLIR